MSHCLPLPIIFVGRFNGCINKAKRGFMNTSNPKLNASLNSTTKKAALLPPFVLTVKIL